MNFLEKLDKAVEKNKSLVCVGLDPDMSKIPGQFKTIDDGFYEFCKAIVDATHDLVCAYKPNPAFFEAQGSIGIVNLEKITAYIRVTYPEIPIIYDCKRGDIGNTNKAYAISAFDHLQVDAVTLHPYFGKTSLQPFLEYKDKGMIVMIKSSNEGSGEFQDLSVGNNRLFEQIVKHVKDSWNDNGNCVLMVGATYPEELAAVRKIAGDNMQILVPGVGAQGGVAEMLKAGLNSRGKGLIINSSRSVLYAASGEDFAQTARKETKNLKAQINQFR